MTRARFLLVSVLATLGSLFHLDREKLSRRWLERNGFKVDTESKEMPEGVRYITVISLIGKGISGAFSLAAYVPPDEMEVCWHYLSHVMVQRDFVITIRHTQMLPINWESLNPITWVETAPPEYVRFERPWFV
jgi:hypothetical protein